MTSKKEAVWDKAKKIRGENPNEYRQDPYGNTIYKASYGKSSPMGWDIDHIKPKAKGGSDSIRNLQALQTSVNRSKGDDERKSSRHSRTNK